MKKIKFRANRFFALLLAMTLFLLTACAGTPSTPGGTTGGDASDGAGEGEIVDPGTEETPIDEERHSYAFVSRDGDTYTYAEGDSTVTMTVTCDAGTAGAISVAGNTVTISGLTEDSTYTFSGTFYGNIVAEGSEDVACEIVFSDFSLTSYDACPVFFSGFDKATLSAKKGTENFVFDLRDAVGDEEISATVYADCDLSVQGKGVLTVVSENNNGVHTKDDLKVKNLTLRVECEDNALKGNDSVTVSSGDITLIARTGDGIKTKSTDVSSKGNQRGNVTITGGTLLIYAACDGIDAAHDVTIDESEASVTLTVFTDRYSSYSEEVSASNTGTYTIRTQSAAYVYSILYSDGTGEDVWKNSGEANRVGNTVYYTVEKPDGYAKMQLFVYNLSKNQGQSEIYVAASDTMSVHEDSDTIVLSSYGGSLRISFANSSSGASGTGRPGGMGGMNEGNTEKGDHSTKGIKAGNGITVLAGTIGVKSYDDAIHANGGEALENGTTSVGNVVIAGGTLTLFSKDDAMHADGDVTVSGGKIRVSGSYEGIEGESVVISGGEISVISDDDGINSTGTSGTGIRLSGGKLYVLAGGDGLDSNSRDSYGGILFEGGDAVILSTGRADSAIDTERGYTYTGGRILAVGRSGGMSAESMNSSPSFSTVGKSASLSLTAGVYLTVSDIVILKMPVTQNSQVLYLGSSTVILSSVATSSASFDFDGVFWN